MVFVFFIYGLAFFVLGVAIFIYPKKDSHFKLAEDLWLVGAFGVLHGVNEWIDMFMLIQVPHEISAFKVIRAAVMPLSFVFLVQFGVKAISTAPKVHSYLKGLTFVLPVSWVFIFGLTHERFLYGDIWGRYLLGFSGSILTAVALFSRAPDLKGIELASARRDLKISAACFAVYAVLAGLVVPGAGFLPAAALNYTRFSDIFGFPVQILRAVIAVMIAGFLGRILDIFNWETRAKLLDRAETLEKMVWERTRELNAANEELSIANEALDSANRELVAGSEELGQSNRELEGLKEFFEKKVGERTAELGLAKQALEKKVADLDRFNRLSVGRELKMKELKGRIRELEEKLEQREAGSGTLERNS